MSRTRVALACLAATVAAGTFTPSADASYGTGSYGTGSYGTGSHSAGLAKKAQGFKYARALRGQALA